MSHENLGNFNPKELLPHLFPSERKGVIGKAIRVVEYLREVIKTAIDPSRTIRAGFAWATLYAIEKERETLGETGEPMDESREAELIQNEWDAQQFLKEHFVQPPKFPGN